MEKELLELVENISGKELKDLSLDYDLVTNGIIDSLTMMELIDEMEERYGINIAGEDTIPENFDTITHMINLIKGNKNQS